jgi:hypothetical protein
MRLIVMACLAISTVPSAAWAKCGDFGGLGEAVALGAGAGAGLIATAVSTAVLSDLDPEARLLAPFLSGAVAGGVVTPSLVFAVSSAAGCEPGDPEALFGLQIGLSTSMGVVGVVAGHYLFRGAPVSVVLTPTEGGAAMVVGGRF